MSCQSEYNNSAVQGGACAYTNLSYYNNGAQGMASAPAAAAAAKTLIVPGYNASAGYNTLQGWGGPVPTCSGYGTLYSAYGSNSGGCSSQFVSKLCQQ